MNRWFGRITPERTRAELLAEARELSKRYRVLHVKNNAIAQRAVIESRHSLEMAEHYERVIRDFNVVHSPSLKEAQS